ncbi:MAG: S8 family serine peptidase [Oligoflexia bacterium]|nr:S8 family serine peptidase [Oligoflexia bacterium]
MLIAGARVERNLGTGSLVTKGNAPQAFSINGEDSTEYVAFDADDTFCAELMASDSSVQSCNPDYKVSVLGVTPNDPKFAQLWGMNGQYGIDAPRAWDLTKGSSDVVVAIIDTGVDYNHPDLSANIWTNSGEIAGDGVDNDGNGYKDDIHGINVSGSSPTGNPMDNNSHGSHVAGTIGGLGNNGTGVVGVNWHVKIMGLKFLAANGSGSLSGAIQAINYMNMMKARGVNIRVSNNSWGGGGYSQAMFDAISRANDAGIIFAAAAGNESNDNDASPSYPASYNLPNVVSVAALESSGNLAGFSNYGAQSVDIAAPGADIVSTTPNNTYASYSGTSMATPHVSGALALLLANEPGLSASQAIQRVYDAGVPLSTLTNVVRTGRTLNVARMVYNETDPVPPQVDLPACNYSVEQIPFTPNSAADAAAIVQQADELNFVRIDLPFTFNFKQREFVSGYVSPNGVFYFGNPPSSMDYQNSAAAPYNSIAALHTDLVANLGTTQGVRVASDQNSVTIRWEAKQYGASSGLAYVYLQLNSDNSSRTFVRFQDAKTQSAIASTATVGLNGAPGQGSDTYAVNAPAKVYNNLGLQWNKLCDDNGAGNSAVVTKLAVSAVGKGTLSSGKKFKIKGKGFGNGPIAIQAAVNGQACEGVAYDTMVDGASSAAGTFPKLFSSKPIRVTFSAGGASRSAQVNARKIGVKSKLSAKQVASFCSKLVGSIH